MKTIILLPTYNELENLPLIIESITKLNLNIDILIIDDNSPDGTGDLAEELKSKYPHVSVLHRKNKEGLGKAYIHGFHVAIDKNYNKIITMDCDFSHDPKYLPQMISLAQKYDLILGSRYIKNGGVVGWGLWRKFISRGGNIYARIILGIPYSDLTGGFKCYDVQTLKETNIENLYSQGYTFQIETTYLIHRKGFKIKEMPIVFKDRVRGVSKMTFDIAWEAIKLIPKLRRRD